MTSKERAALRAQANTIETTLIVGKGGVSEPISLLAYMMVTRQVSGRMAALTCSAVTVPISPTGSSSTSKPSFSSFFSVCSTA